MSNVYASNTLLDNSNDVLKVVNALKEYMNDESIYILKIATAYWDLPALSLIYDELSCFLKRENSSLQLLIGTEPIARKYQLKEPVLSSEEYIRRHISELNVTEQYIRVVQLLLDYCTVDHDSKIKIKMLKNDSNGNPVFLHAKTYIFLGKGLSKAIIGSSNFTKRGLTENTELNYLETNSMIVNAIPNENSYSMGHNFWFDKKWEIAEDWNKYFLEEVLKPSNIVNEIKKTKKTQVNNELTPYELYIKLLQDKFGDLVNKDKQDLIESYLPTKYKTLNYQLDAVSQCYSIMKEHGGFLLSDVVGLGKTIVGTLLIKHFLSIEEDGREKSVLIVTPPAIKSSWIATIKDFDQDSSNKIYNNIDFITTGSIGNLLDDVSDEDIEDVDEDISNFDNQFVFTSNHKNYGLIIIDESHKFRNNSTGMYKSLDGLIAEIGNATGVYPYIGLLSATPQNNRPEDLKNQIYLFERDRKQSSLTKADGGNIEKFFARINEKYKSIIRSREDSSPEGVIQGVPDDKNDELKKLSLEIRDCILQDILVRRTRTDVLKYYKDDLMLQQIKFPSISGPHELEYKLSPKLAELFSSTMDYICPHKDFNFDEPSSICYYRYRSFAYLLDEKNKSKYCANNRSAQDVALQLAKIMQINLVKRLESSFLAFKQSLKNLRQYTKNMIDMWDHNSIFICPNIDVNAEFMMKPKDGGHPNFVAFDVVAESIRKKIKKLSDSGKNDNESNKEYCRNDFDSSFIDKLRVDYQIIDWLYSEWTAYDNDPKLEKFKKCLREELLGKEQKNKLVIFTEAIDTVNSLERAINSEFSDINVLYITAENRKDNEQIIRENFDANYDGEWKNDYQIIVTTEVLSEGINLHRANTILNYDTPWNSTRLMQRIGRVNRIGSKSDIVYVYNFMPSSEGDKQINLVQKAFVKLQSFHTIFGEDNKVFSNKESVVHYPINKFINGEESPAEKYIYELKEYKRSNEERYKYIESLKTNLEISTASENKLASYFVVKLKNSSSIYVECDSELNTKVLSAFDMFQKFKPKKEEERGNVFPINWESQKKAAVDKVMETLTWRKNFLKKSKRVTDAKGYIKKYGYGKIYELQPQTKKIFETVFSILHYKGNLDLAALVIKVFSAFDKHSDDLLKISDEEFNRIVVDKFLAITNRITTDQIDAKVYIGMSK